MEYHNVIDKILGQKSKVKILRYLVEYRDEQSGRRIARECGINHWQCHHVLQDLCQQGILNMHRVGNAYLFSLRRNHYLVEKAIIPLFQSEARLLQALAAEVKQIRDVNISSLILFGSIARGKGKPRSDIDILVVTSRKKNKGKVAEKICKRNDYFLSRYGNALSPYVVSETEFRERHKKGDKLIRNIIKNGKTLSGKSIGELVAK